MKELKNLIERAARAGRQLGDWKPLAALLMMLLTPGSAVLAQWVVSVHYIESAEIRSYTLPDGRVASGWHFRNDGSKRYSATVVDTDWKTHKPLPSGVVVEVYGVNGPRDQRTSLTRVATISNADADPEKFFKDGNVQSEYFVLVRMSKDGRDYFVTPATEHSRDDPPRWRNVLFEGAGVTVRIHYSMPPT